LAKCVSNWKKNKSKFQVCLVDFQQYLNLTAFIGTLFNDRLNMGIITEHIRNFLVKLGDSKPFKDKFGN
jgi:hypothetical protein